MNLQDLFQKKSSEELKPAFVCYRTEVPLPTVDEKITFGIKHRYHLCRMGQTELLASII